MYRFCYTSFINAYNYKLTMDQSYLELVRLNQKDCFVTFPCSFAYNGTHWIGIDKKKKCCCKFWDQKPPNNFRKHSLLLHLVITKEYSLALFAPKKM